jgi:hypothetical protein
VSRALEALSEHWEANQPPDYTESLGEITHGLLTVVDRLTVIERHPALRATPAQHQAAILSAGHDLMSRAAERIAVLIGTARDRSTQRKHLAWMFTGTVAVSLLILPFLARELPFGWNEDLVVFLLRADRWNAGQALLKSADPVGWARLAAEVQLVESNHSAADACRETAQRTKKEQRCAIVVTVPKDPDT